MDVQYSKESLASPDGTPPSQPSLSDDFRSNYAAPTTGGRRPWLGSELLSEMDKGVPLFKKRDGPPNGYALQAADQPDLLSVMEASWFGKNAQRRNSSSSAFSGFHDSATSMSSHDTKSYPAQSKVLANGDGSAHSSNGGSGSGRSRGSGRSPGRSGGSSGGCPDPAELLTMQGQHGMGVLPEDSDVIGMQQEARGKRAQERRKSRDGPGWLGTWANRQVHYSRGKPPQPSLPAHIPGTPQPSSERSKGSEKRERREKSMQSNEKRENGAAQSHAVEEGGNGNSASRDADANAAGGASGQLPDGHSPEAPSMRSRDSADMLAEDEDALRQAAWRWRFNRRWAQEQARGMDPDYGRQAGDEDGWDEALGYMDACGPGWHLQIARTTSDDGLANESLKSLSNCMLSDSTRSRTLAATVSDTPSMGEATAGIMQKARMARDLYEQQAAIENQVKERWDTAANAGTSWVGQDIPAVQIDKFGKFPYVLVKLSDRMAGNKLIVRGKNGRSEPQLVSAVSKEVLNVTARGRLPQASVTLMGSGLMEWSRERDRVINVSAGKVVAGMDGSLHSREDVARITAALTRASLPMHYRVMLDSERAAQLSSVSFAKGAGL